MLKTNRYQHLQKQHLLCIKYYILTLNNSIYSSAARRHCSSKKYIPAAPLVMYLSLIMHYWKWYHWKIDKSIYKVQTQQLILLTFSAEENSVTLCIYWMKKIRQIKKNLIHTRIRKVFIETTINHCICYFWLLNNRLFNINKGR